jgi:hypothetical protein
MCLQSETSIQKNYTYFFVRNTFGESTPTTLPLSLAAQMCNLQTESTNSYAVNVKTGAKICDLEIEN